MSLADDIDGLSDYPAADEPQYTPRTEFDGVSGFIQTASFRADEPPDFTALLTQFGYNPEQVRIVGHPRISRWQQRAACREWSDTHKAFIRNGKFETVWLQAYRFTIQAINTQPDTDLAALITAAQDRPRYTQGSYWAVFQAGDLQLGKKSSAGSTPQIIERYLAAVENACREIRSLKRLGIEGIQISMPGDCIEGTVSQDGKNNGWLTVETAPEQTRILRRLMYHTVEAFAPLANRVYLDVVNGNHDQAQRQLNTWPGDGWATEQAIEVSDRLKDKPEAFGHCEVRVPDKWRGCMTVPVGDTVVTIVHGHQWRRNKAADWWAGQTMNGLPPGGAQVMQHGHYHTWEIEEVSAERTRIESPTFDLGSDWFQEKTGATCRRGGLVYLLRSGEVSRMTVV